MESTYLTYMSKKWIPLLLVFLSGLGFSIQSIILKFLAEYGLPGVLLTTFCRGLIQLAVSIIFITLDRKSRDIQNMQPIFGANTYTKFLLFLRSFFGFVSTVGGFMAVETLPVGDGTVLIMLNTVFCGILGVFILGEPWKLTQICATCASLVGAILVCRPSFFISFLVNIGLIRAQALVTTANALGVFCGLFAAVFSGASYITIRLLGTTAKMPWPNVTFSQALGQIFIPLPMLFFIPKENLLLIVTQIQWTQLVTIFVAGFVGTWSQIAMTVGMVRENSETASAMRMSDIVFGFMWQGIFTSDKISGLSVIGATLVMMSIVMVVFFKNSDIPPGDEMTSMPVAMLKQSHISGTKDGPSIAPPMTLLQKAQSVLMRKYFTPFIPPIYSNTSKYMVVPADDIEMNDVH